MSTSIIPDTPSAHARQIRLLVTALQQNPPVFPATPPPFHTLTPTTLPPLLPPIFSALNAQRTFLPSLSLLNSIIISAPPSVLYPHISPVYQRLASFLNSSNSLLTRARVLAIIANLFRALNASPDNSAPILRSALSHASKALQEDVPPLQLSALAVFLVVLQFAPKELRKHLPALHCALPPLFSHPNPQLSHAAAVSYAHILTISDHSALQSTFDTRLTFLLDRLDDVHHVLDQFAGLNAGPVHRQIHSDIHAFQLSQLASYYTSVCTVLKAQLGISAKVQVSVAPLLHSFMRGFAHRQFDPYVSVSGTALDVNAAIEMSLVVTRESLVALTEVLRKLGNVILPFAEIVAAAVERKMGRTLISFRTHGGNLGLEERTALYRLVVESVQVFGGAFVEGILGVFVDLFNMEVVFHATCTEGAKPMKRRVSVLEAGRRRKRRHQREVELEPRHVDHEKREAKAIGVAVLSKVRKVLEEGLQVCIAVFNNRGLVNAKTIEAMEKLESVLSDMADGEMSDQALEALCATALGGGASRLRAAASPLLFKCARQATAIALESRSGHRKLAMQTRSACEAAFHSRGPPIMKRAPGNTVELVEEVVPKSKERISAEKRSGNGEHGSVPMLVDSVNKNDRGKSSDAIPTPSAALKNGSLANISPEERIGYAEERLNANLSKQAAGSIPENPNPCKQRQELQEVSTKNPAPNGPVVGAAVAGSEKDTSGEHAQPLQTSIAESREKDEQTTASTQGTAKPFQKEVTDDVNTPVRFEREKKVTVEQAIDVVNENRGSPTTFHPEKIDREGQDVTLDADEEALIASLRFEPSDEE